MENAYNKMPAYTFGIKHRYRGSDNTPGKLLLNNAYYYSDWIICISKNLIKLQTIIHYPVCWAKQFKVAKDKHLPIQLLDVVKLEVFMKIFKK